MSKLVFITGGARSGKSSFAAALAEKSGKNVVFMATGEAKDKEMADRITIHQNSRPKSWKTVEEPLIVSKKLPKLPKNTDAVIIDCLTLLVSNLMLTELSEKTILSEISNIVKAAKSSKFDTIVVSNELGSGIVPENKLAREFRDVAGRANQLVAKKSNEAYLMVSGLPIKLKIH